MNLLPEPESAGTDVGGWILRGSVAAFFVVMGLEKFPSDPRGAWVPVFKQIGIGQWFRYATGVVEILGGVLFLFPRTCLIGGAILTCTMVGAMLVHIVVRDSIGGSVFPAFVLAESSLIRILPQSAPSFHGPQIANVIPSSNGLEPGGVADDVLP